MKIIKTNSFLKLCTLTLILFVSGYENSSLASSYKNTEEVNTGYKSNKNSLSPRINAKKKVLLVGIDGLQFEKIRDVSTPNLDKLRVVKAYTGGIKGTNSEQATISGPSWTTILTGVWVNKHRVRNNSSSNRAYAKSVFKLIKEVNPSLRTASVVTWSPIHKFFDWQSNYIDYKSDSGGDANTVAQVVNHINTANPDFIFAHLDDVDVVGHNSGFGLAYNVAIKKADRQLGQMMLAVEGRARTRNEDWLIIVTTDHGRGSGGFNHGGQSTQEKTIFIGMNKPGNAEFNSYVSDIPNRDFGGIYGHAAQTSIVPTILTHLNIPIKKEWQLSSTSLIGALGPRKVMLKNNNKNSNTIFWRSNSSNNVYIYRDHRFLARVKASQGYYIDS